MSTHIILVFLLTISDLSPEIFFCLSIIYPSEFLLVRVFGNKFSQNLCKMPLWCAHSWWFSECWILNRHDFHLPGDAITLDCAGTVAIWVWNLPIYHVFWNVCLSSFKIIFLLYSTVRQWCVELGILFWICWAPCIWRLMSFSNSRKCLPVLFYLFIYLFIYFHALLEYHFLLFSALRMPINCKQDLLSQSARSLNIS